MSMQQEFRPVVHSSCFTQPFVSIYTVTTVPIIVQCTNRCSFVMRSARAAAYDHD
jgi:homogentisate 1,2-dioxygenase